MEFNWPDKDSREILEINGFIEAYNRLPHGRQFVIESKGDKPDYILRDDLGIKVGVELTSVYLNDRSVPDEHIPAKEAMVSICDDKNLLEIYLKRIVEAIEGKIKKARKGYTQNISIILSVYINEYISIYITRDELNRLVRENLGVFDAMSPLSEIVLWNLPNNDVFSIRPDP